MPGIPSLQSETTIIAKRIVYLKYQCAQKSGKKKQHKHKLFGPDFPRTFLTLTPGRPGVKKFLPTTRAAGNRTFWCGRPRFSARTSMTRRVVKNFVQRKFALIFQELPSYGSGRYGSGVFRPRFHSARQVLCGDASRLFLDHFSKHSSSVLGGQSSVARSGIPGSKKPKSSARKTTICQNCLQWGRSNLVDPAEWPKIRLQNRDFGNTLSIFPRKNGKTQSSLNFL